mmetsp:Transcript_18711/g.36673  ORF Transcript_18711/g.36673 Transcript_18711/m.36673 type:complete len:228 (+) Transcript_18711:498-1181(+)
MSNVRYGTAVFLKSSLNYDSLTKTVLELNNVKQMKTISHTILSMVEVPEQLSWFKKYFSVDKVEEAGKEDFANFDLFEIVKEIAIGNSSLYLEEIDNLYEYRYELYDEFNQWEEALKTGHFQPNAGSHNLSLKALKGVNLGDILPVLNPTDSGEHTILSDEQMNELYQMLLISEKSATFMSRKCPYSNRHGVGKDGNLNFPINFAMIDSYRQQAKSYPKHRVRKGNS